MMCGNEVEDAAKSVRKMPVYPFIYHMGLSVL